MPNPKRRHSKTRTAKRTVSRVDVGSGNLVRALTLTSDLRLLVVEPNAAKARAFRDQLRDAVNQTMDRLKLDAFVYPTWSNPPAIIGDVRQNLAGDNSQVYSPTTGFPAITVPMGFTRGGTLPAGLTIFGRPWDEGHLFAFAYAYEQATHHRKPPPTTPPLK
jgi:Asp-tRNA(Asn)/Glu-tRNA(Gln) amidotransferase A subunit family amidase